MSATNRILFYLLLVRCSLLITGVTGQLDTYNDDEDLTHYTEFSGSGDSQTTDVTSPKQTELTIQAPAIDMTSGNQGQVIQLQILGNSQIKLRGHAGKKPHDVKDVGEKAIPDSGESTLQNTDKVSDYTNIVTLEAANDRVNDGTGKNRSTLVSNKKLDKPKSEKKLKKASGKERSTKKPKKKKKKKVINGKKKQKSRRKNKQNTVKTINLGEPKSKETVLLKQTNKRKHEEDSQKDYHIRRNIVSNSHQDHPKHRRHHHNKDKQKKRWRKNMDSNRHGYGSKSTYKKRKPTFEDRWPGCFKKYESCYRDSNCCNSNCQQFTWLSFGFCL